ncbi:hypothetical protein LEP1GSC194_1912 [Leptospira alstonii serovar Sichuan str. 79601]|uniref:Uncharacterized protein n=1 Tax=Leptospira alstonii serovar Sichuan str. 79601 TaxID=1218565 RepID=M6CME2_9LEPT|nr:hypothetical protein LEP1GSC194_1912 [Leptospira alstonii serovar Sichuan str. 79601]
MILPEQIKDFLNQYLHVNFIEVLELPGPANYEKRKTSATFSPKNSFLDPPILPVKAVLILESNHLRNWRFKTKWTVMELEFLSN